MKLWSLVLVAALALTGLNAEAAKRLGGGKSMGQQSSNVTQRQATPPPAAPGQNAAQAAPQPAPGMPPAAAPKRPWGAMLGGLAAGLGLAWLAHSMGLGEGMGQFLMFALLAMGAVMLIGWFMRSRRPAQAAPAPFAFQGAAGSVPTLSPRPYSPDHVGNDASARPWERNTTSLDANASGSMIGSGLTGSQSWGVPAGFDTEGFLKAAKTNFVSMQAAWDKSDVATLRAMMTDGMLAEIQSQFAEREANPGNGTQQTDVVMLEASLLGIEDRANDYMASVEFNGMIREEPSAGPAPFREVWNMTKPKAGGGWLVAGVQALQ